MRDGMLQPLPLFSGSQTVAALKPHTINHLQAEHCGDALLLCQPVHISCRLRTVYSGRVVQWI